jgi:hypothetical protein
MKPKLTLPGTKRLKLKCGKLLSSFAFKFNLRQYVKEEDEDVAPAMATFAGAARGALGALLQLQAGPHTAPFVSSS